MAPNADVLKASSRAVPVRWGGLRDESKERLGGRLVHEVLNKMLLYK